ncbi:hypothetical protein [Piscinibacter sp. XHJ-5]|uniref:hypothetical protein n=1 Tax=Piscinibacter sp. XHJ-5 TaxID=3037797 RepID=UPI0024534127|nr:hypothetical protein [Piscinibacter sp. XHJ-5]
MTAQSRTDWINRFVARMTQLGMACDEALVAAKAADVWELHGHADPVVVADAEWPAGLAHVDPQMRARQSIAMGVTP